MEHVKLVKKICIAILVTLAVGLMIAVFVGGVKNKISINSTQQNDSNSIFKPILISKDNKGRKFFISAKHGEQSLQNNKICLSDINGSLGTDNGNILITADHGDSKLNSKDIKLSGNIKLISEDKGHELLTESLDIYYDKFSITSNEPVVVKGSNINLSANKFLVKNNGDEILFSDNVIMVLY